MLSDRLNLALETGALTLPSEGRIAVIGPRSGADLSMLPQDRVTVVQRMYPENHWFKQAGFETAVAIDGPYALSIVCLPRAKAEARVRIVEARNVTAGPLVIDGQKTEGVDSLLKEIRRIASVGEILSKSHGKIFVVDGGDFTTLASPAPDKVEGRFETAPGAFSVDAVDPGSKALADALPDTLKGSVVDLGAGWGFLSEAILNCKSVTSVDLVEADHAALESARRNIQDDRARFHWADALSFRPKTPADHVVTNPPFHTGRTAEPALGQSFIRAAASMLARHGQLWLVANRHLPYEATLKEAFREVRLLSQTPSYKLYNASAPRSLRKG